MLPYDAETLDAFLALLNRSLWPIQPLALLLAAAALALALRPRAVPQASRIVSGLLALAWAWVGWDFFLQRFAELNFAAPLYGAGFLLQALLLLGLGLLRGRPAFGPRAPRFARTGAALALLALLACPLAGALLAGDWQAAPLVGLTPGPTALFTLGLLLLSGRGALPLAVLPSLWCLVAGFEGWALGLPQDLALLALGLGGGALLVLRGRPAGASG
ncbi:hypothetical protein SAMN06265365_1432 [Tistlia consotensis]|uniref:Uncharacterized protein n=1 Tax=Tistlia consotensis USBA 355 TaxID=560819 RepID=A0A1Y6BFY0_9PROT|nr:DUF6064 family protein [Tistlia consotensis]SMF01930.1 hypothetical protein SAMN05428998_10311 [Tistlia consotensis USBA 355]SNS25987.1 hypothetical protein SAMN06265365_1432 [Tistlia consotensis]